MGRPAAAAATGLQFFGSPDMAYSKEEGVHKVTSSYPAWYFVNKIEQLKEEIASYESSLMHTDDEERKARMRDRINRLKKRLKEILDSKPKLTADQRSLLGDMYIRYGKLISDFFFTRDEMEKGFASPHEVYRRSKDFMYGEASGVLTSQEEKQVLINLNVKIVSNKINGDDIIRVWKIIGALLDEETNPERLRRDKRAGGAYKPEKKFSELMKEIGED